MTGDFEQKCDELLDEGAVMHLFTGEPGQEKKIPLADLMWLDDYTIAFAELSPQGPDEAHLLKFTLAESENSRSVNFHDESGKFIARLGLMRDDVESRSELDAAKLFRQDIKTNAMSRRSWRVRFLAMIRRFDGIEWEDEQGLV